MNDTVIRVENVSKKILQGTGNMPCYMEYRILQGMQSD